jgi:threonine/homoserine/homoserine lactone efflux protein
VVRSVTADLLAGAVAGLAVAMPVGAIGAYLLGLAARERFSVAAAAALGVASVDGAYALIASLGGAGLKSLLQRTSAALSVAAALVLVVLAILTLQRAIRRYRAVAPPISRAGRLASPPRAYAALVGLTAVNPATVITFSAVVLGRPLENAGVSWLAIGAFTVGAFAASAAWQLLLVGSGSLLGRLLAGRHGQLAIACASALLMLGLAVAVLLR